MADRFERGPRELGGAGIAGEAEKRAARIRIPIGRAQPDEGRDEIDLLGGRPLPRARFSGAAAIP